MNATDRRPERLRFGILASGTTLKAWQAQTVRHLLEVPGVELALLVVDARPRPERGVRSRLQRLRSSPTALWDLYNNGWVARRATSLRPVDMKSLLGTVPRLEVVVDKQGWSEYFPATAIEEIRGHELDFLLRFGFGIIRGDILTAARFGVWSFHHDDEEYYRGSPPAFWELVDGQPVTGAVLQRLTDRLDGGQILARGWFRSARHSYVRNTDTVHWGGTEWPARVCRAILAGDLAAGEGTPSSSEAPIYRKPDNWTTSRFLVTQAARFLSSQLGGLVYADQWDIGLVDAPIHRFLDPTFRPTVRWLGLGQPPHIYAADPFAMPSGDTVLYERFDNATRTGEIWQAPLPGSAHPHNGYAPPTAPALPLSSHASYPFVFSDRSETFCLPQVAGQPPRLYRLHGKRWEEVATLLEEPVLDPTVIRWDGRWWLLATRPGRDSLTKLHLWWADDLTGPWRPHTLNPVKTDVRSARPAGTPFVHDGRLYRPAQDCSAGYGAAVALCEITELGPTSFAETVLNVVRPDPSWPRSRGLHTLSAAGDRTLLDARGRAISRYETAAELRGRLQHLRRSI